MALSLSHAIRVTEVMLALERTASADGMAFVSHDDWTEKEEPRLTQMRWSVRINYDGKSLRTDVVPDGTFALDHHDKRSCFFLEVDRGTMPATRSNSEQTSFRRKVLAYKATRDAGILWKRHGIAGFRVLVVAESERRLRSLRAAAASCFQRGESAMFCFAVTAQLIGEVNILNHAWLSPGGAELRPLARAS